MRIATRRAARRGKYVHAASEEWKITSNVPVDAILTCTPLDVALPGRMGTFFYPDDAVFVSSGRTFDEVRRDEQERMRRADSSQINHRTVSQAEAVEEEEEEEEEEESVDSEAEPEVWEEEPEDDDDDQT
jgi:hypothetical protein